MGSDFKDFKYSFRTAMEFDSFQILKAQKIMLLVLETPNLVFLSQNSPNFFRISERPDFMNFSGPEIKIS